MLSDADSERRSGVVDELECQPVSKDRKRNPRQISYRQCLGCDIGNDNRNENIPEQPPTTAAAWHLPPWLCT